MILPWIHPPTPPCPYSAFATPYIRLAAGQHIFDTGNLVGDFIYLIISGHIKQYQHGLNGCLRIIDFCAAGDWLGCDSIAQEKYQSGAMALTACTLAAIPFQELTALLDSQPLMAQAFYGAINSRIERQQQHAVLLRSGDAAQRFASFLLQMVKDDHFAPLPMRRQDIADYLGMTLETVSRQFSQVHRRGWLAVQDRSIALTARAQIERVASGTQR